MEFIPKAVSDMDVMLGADGDLLDRLMPFTEESAEYRKHYKGKFADKVSDLFFKGGSTQEWKTKEGIDRNMALRHFKAVLKSFAPSHELKTSACAFMLQEWFEEESLFAKVKI